MSFVFVRNTDISRISENLCITFVCTYKMVLYVREVSVHGRTVLLTLGTCSCILTLVSTTFLRAAPSPSPTQAVLTYLLPHTPHPYVLTVHGVLSGRRGVLHVLAGCSDVAVVVVGMVLVVGGDRWAGRRALSILGLAHWALMGQVVILGVSAVLWGVVSFIFVGVHGRTDAWKHLEDAYTSDPAARMALEDIQFYLGCCGLVGGDDPLVWVREHNGVVYPTCCAPESHLPCLYDNLFGYEGTKDRVRKKNWFRHVLPLVLHVSSCPTLALSHVQDRAKHVLIVLMLGTFQNVFVAGMAVSVLYNSALNRDTLTHAPATVALTRRFMHAIPLAQL